MAEPMNPVAGAAGPGKFSVRNDLPPSQEYGERKQMQEIMQGAPTATTRGAADPKLGRPRTALAEVTPLLAQSQRPDEPITAGIDLGAGPDSSALAMRSMYAEESLSQALAQMLPYDTNGEIAALYEQAVSRGL
jgi:hypothetical protein